MDINLVNGYNKIYKKIVNKNKLEKIKDEELIKFQRFKKLNNSKSNNEICLENTKYLIGKILINRNYTMIIIINMLILFLQIFLSKEENYVSEITITVEGNGNQSILSDTKTCGGKSISVDYNPDQILINGESQDYKDKIVYNLNNSINNITIKWNNNFVTSACMFMNLDNIIRVDLSYFDASQITDMRYMFSGCTSLTSINFDNLNTSKVTIVRSMFDSCISLTSLNLNGFDTSSISVMIDMFNNCSSIKSLDLSNFDTSEVTSMDGMFKYCTSLKSLNLNNFNTKNTQNMKNMFYGCSSLIFLNIDNFDTSKVNYMDSMFYGCSSLITLDLNNFDMTKIKTYEDMISGCDNLIVCINNTKSSEIKSLLSLYKQNCPFFCFEKSQKMVNESLICINDCNNNEDKFEYNNICYKTCPNGANVSSENEHLCEKECPDNLPYEDIQTNECIEKCKAIDIFNNICKIKNKNNSTIKSYIVSCIKKELENGDMSPLLSKVLEDNEDLFIQDIDIIYQITSTFNQANNKYMNLSIIRLNECENILKKHYNISKEEPLIIFKIEIYQYGLLIPLIEYGIYNSKGKIKSLDVSYCKNRKINITIPVSINENDLSIYNSSDEYYNDICYSFTTKNGTDIILSDRQKEFIKNNLSLCESNCEYKGYNLVSKTVECDCDIKNGISSYSEDDFDKNILLNNFIDFNNTFNIKVMKCYKLLFSKKGLKSNIGSYILLIIIFIVIIFCFIFIVKGYQLVLDELNKLLKLQLIGKKNIDETIVKDKIKMDKNSIDNKMTSKINFIQINTDYRKILISGKEKKRKKIKRKKKQISKIKINNPIRKKSQITIDSSKINEGEGATSSHKGMKPTKAINKIKKEITDASIFNNIKKNKKNKKNEKDINYNDYELNNLPYIQALEHDKRTFIDYYMSLIKMKQLFIFTFYTQNDYNSRIIKICLFLFSFASYFIVNALFFTDSTMHKIYENQGKYDLIYQIPQILYSTVISILINTIIKSISLTEKNILSIKKENINLKKKYIKIIKWLKLKFVLFFIIIFVFLLVFWYYISCFCAVYKNTQIYLLKDTMISFGLSLLYPFGLNLIPGIIRIPSLQAAKRNKECVYKLSQIIQLI